MADKSTERRWWDLTGRFRDKANEFLQLVDEVKNTPAPPNLRREKQLLLSRADNYRATVDNIVSTIKQATDWLQGNQVGELGAIQFLPIAAISVALAAISKWVVDAYTFLAKIEEQQRLESGGLSPNEAANVIAKQSGQGGVTRAIQSITVPALILGAVYLWSQHASR